MTDEEKKAKQRASSKAWYEANKEKCLAQQKAYKAANKEKCLAQKKAYREANREANREKAYAYNKAYKEKHKEKIRAQKKAWAAANPEKVKAGQQRHYAKLNIVNADLSQRTLKAWAHQVKSRDNNSCSVCGSSEDLHAHHIFPKSIFPERALLIDNGVTLCETHHKEHHSLNPMRQWRTE